ncbi:serine hydroxymethyltransferase, partial [Erysipelothrix rhusiopathiae]|nr:serine hydroxymethyltransferase [Erysipelothrix rhusiopathiae]
GGPLMHVIAGKAVCFYEALQPNFKTYQQQVILNAKTLAQEFSNLGYRLVSGGTDNHLILVDVKNSIGMTGAHAEKVLDKVGITINKNAIPFDTERPAVTSGIRLGSPAMTSRGFKEEEFKKIAHWIHEALTHYEDDEILTRISNEVKTLTRQYPVRGERI